MSRASRKFNSGNLMTELLFWSLDNAFGREHTGHSYLLGYSPKSSYLSIAVTEVTASTKTDLGK